MHCCAQITMTMDLVLSLTLVDGTVVNVTVDFSALAGTINRRIKVRRQTMNAQVALLVANV